MKQFSPELRDAVRSGAITVSYRLWQRPHVKLGGRYPLQDVVIEVDSINLVPFSSIDDADLALTGERDLESVRRRAAHAGPVHDDTLLYRIEFHII
ncbi:MAG TPA: ASCH domain-containing protein [Acidimicrobiales bacterium]|nr:ASCH domain-containing protein [Acidimicrobiales bacterium]